MSSNPDDEGLNPSVNKNNDSNNDNKRDRNEKQANDSTSLKSETSSISRPLRFGTTDDNKNREDLINNNLNNEPSDTDNERTLPRFPTLTHCTNESQDERTPCCANLALDLYRKALESAKKALPKNKPKPVFPRSFGEDFESLGPEGFHYLDDAQTECSYDYRDIDFNRDSIFRPETLAAMDGIPIVIHEDSEPQNLDEMKERYGLPENADTVIKYDPKKSGPHIDALKSDVNLSNNLDEEIEENKVQIEKVIEETQKSDPRIAITVENKCKIIPEKPKRSDPKSEEMIREYISENISSGDNTSEGILSAIDSGVIIRTKPVVKSLKPPDIQVEVCNEIKSENISALDLMANRTSQLILEDVFESLVKPQNDDKKSSVESEKDLKKQKKELEKQLKKAEKLKKKEEKVQKELEKKKKKVEKLNKDFDKQEKKQLFSRFKSEDKQKKKIMKKTKEFEKIKKDLEKKRFAECIGNVVVREEDDDDNEVYEKGFSDEKHSYEDIDQKSIDQSVKSEVNTIPSVKLETPETESVVKVEFVENIKEIGVTYIPSDDGIENENYVEEYEEQKGNRKTGLKSKVSSFKMPKMGALKTKVKEIFPKKQPKHEKSYDNKIEITDSETPEKQTEIQIENERNIVFDTKQTPSLKVKFEKDLKPSHEYENVVETGIEVKQTPEIVFTETVVNEYLTTDDEKDKEQTMISSQNNKNKKKKKSKAKSKLNRFKEKAIESLPRISSFKSKVKDLFPKRDPKDLEYERFMTDHESYSHRMRYESDAEAVSDSELCDSLHRNSVYGRRHVYEEMAATQERLDAYMTPISGPLRPPRRFSSMQSGHKVSSVPSLSTQVMIRPKRLPPPRPPPPRPQLPKIDIPIVQITVEPNESRDNTLKRKTKQRVPANIYYNNIRLGYKPKRRFINLKSRSQLLNYDQPKSPIAVRTKSQILTYDRPKSPIAVKNGKRVVRNCNNQTIIDRNIRNLDEKYNTMPEMDIKMIAQSFDYKSDEESIYPKYEDIELRSRAPRPPPRRKHRAHRSQTVDALYWRPFSWKYKRCRSLTELDVRHKNTNNREILKPNYENVIAIKPPRPPPPSGSIKSVKNKISDISHIYSSVHKGSKSDFSKRPLPPPPVPPRPKCMSLSNASTPVSNQSKSQSVSNVSRDVTTRDVSVSTKDNGLILVCEKETQCVNDISDISHDLNGNLESESVNVLSKSPKSILQRTPTTLELKSGTDYSMNSELKTPTNLRPETPTTPTPTNSIDDIDQNMKESVQRSIAEQCPDLTDSTVTLSSLNTTTSYFDAEEPDDWDEETLNDDISSIASNYQSLSSDVTIASSKCDSAPAPEPQPEPATEPSIVPTRPLTTKISGKRSQSIIAPPEESIPRAPRRSLPDNQLRKMGSIDDDSEDTDELLGLARDLQSELKQILDRRSKLPQRPDSTNSSNASLHEPIDSSSDGDDYSLSSVTEQSNEFLKRKQQQKLYFIAKELYSSEEIFVDVLHLLNCDFRSVVDSHLPEDVLNSILKFLPQLQQINEQLLSELKIRIDNWAQIQRISDVLVKICPFLKQYSLYIRDFETISANYDEALRRHPSFATAVKEFESTPRCQKLSVKHFMLKPVQRLPQYRLLLQDYLRHLDNDSDDYLDTVNALNIVSQVAEHANNTMKLGDNVSKLLSIQNSIIGGNEIIKPGRLFIKEGELMKLSRKGMQERFFILFNDSFMYLTPVQNGVFRVNYELSLTGMRVSLPTQQDFQNEFSVISHTRSFSLAARSTKEREEWVKAINSAIKEHINKRISFAKSGSQAEDPILALELGNCAPVWIPDARVTMCQLCTEEFSVTFRRHHCRCCGKVVCSACSANKAPLPYLKNRTARVCDECYEKLRLQLEQMEKHVQECGASSGEVNNSESDEGWSLNAWKQQFVRNLPRSSNRKMKTRYVPSVLKEVCANDEGSLISGYLHRRESKRNWKRYWFVIKDLVLYTYKASEDVVALKSLPLLGFKVEALKDSVDGIDHKSLFQLSHPGQPTIIFRAETLGSQERWFKAMQLATHLE